MQIVYFIQAATGQVKIGRTSDLVGRLGTLQVGNHEELTLVGAVFGSHADEQALHARFARHFLRGEWYLPEVDLLHYVRDLPQDIVESFGAAHKKPCSCGSPWSNTIEVALGKYAATCRRCLMRQDGRLENFRRMAQRPKQKKIPKPCFHCGRIVFIVRHGRCGACSEFLRRHGAERPLGPKSTPCTNCGVRCGPGAEKRRRTLGRCGACYVYLQRHGSERPIEKAAA
jgi:Meiotically Up-regulated Gene 113 (MUG113) protein